jgi:hypothetical protein
VTIDKEEIMDLSKKDWQKSYQIALDLVNPTTKGFIIIKILTITKEVLELAIFPCVFTTLFEIFVKKNHS